MFTIITTILSFILVLGVLVFVHELGHYLAARHVGVRVERFSIGFPPRAAGKTIGETEYVLSWIPLGGYVKLYGQNLDDEDPDDPRNYASKTKLQRAYILFAGPAMNLVVALVLITMVNLLGVEVPAWRYSTPRIFSVEEGSPAGAAGFEPGDRIVSIGEFPTGSWEQLYKGMESLIIEGRELEFSIERSGSGRSLVLDSTPIISGDPPGWRPVHPAVVGMFVAGSAAEAAGMRIGDRLVKIGSAPIHSWRDIPGEVKKSEGSPVEIMVERLAPGASATETSTKNTENRTVQETLTITPKFNLERERWLIGIGEGTRIEQYSLPLAVTLGTEQLYTISKAVFLFLGRCITLNCSFATLGGPLKIAEYSGKAARSGLVPLLTFMSIISLQLGLLNLLPIPALDGGHLFFLGLEGLKRSPLSPKLRERTQLVGLSLLIMLMLAVIFNDIVQMFSVGGSG